MAYQTILFDIDSDHVATLTLNRPEVMDAFNQQMADECADVWRRVKEDVPRDALWDHAHRLAPIVAAKPTLAVQSTIRALWESPDLGRRESLQRHREWYLDGDSHVDRSTFVRPAPRLR